jgi:hypothetical protein
MLGNRSHIFFPPRQSSLLLGDVQELGESGLDLLLGLFAHLVEIGQTRVECTQGGEVGDVGVSFACSGSDSGYEHVKRKGERSGTGGSRRRCVWLCCLPIYSACLLRCDDDTMTPSPHSRRVNETLIPSISLGESLTSAKT